MALMLTIASEKGVGVAEPRDHRGPAQIDNPSAAVSPRLDIGAITDRQDAVAADSERGRTRTSRIKGDDVAVDEDCVCGYFIHPFSRYTRSAPG